MYASDMIFLELAARGDRKTVCDTRIHTPNLELLRQIIFEICSGHYYSSTEARSRHSDPKTVHLYDTT